MRREYRGRERELRGFRVQERQVEGNRKQETGNCLAVEGSLARSRYLFPVSCFLFPAVGSS
jgi:hypothetical protein